MPEDPHLPLLSSGSAAASPSAGPPQLLSITANTRSQDGWGQGRRRRTRIDPEPGKHRGIEGTGSPLSGAGAGETRAGALDPEDLQPPVRCDALDRDACDTAHELHVNRRQTHGDWELMKIRRQRAACHLLTQSRYRHQHSGLVVPPSSSQASIPEPH